MDMHEAYVKVFSAACTAVEELEKMPEELRPGAAEKAREGLAEVIAEMEDAAPLESD